MKIFKFLILPILVNIALLLTSCEKENDKGVIYMLNTLQYNNLNEFSTGQETFCSVKEITEDKTQKELMTKADILFSYFNVIDTLSGDMIGLLDSLKMDMFQSFGEQFSLKKDNSILNYDYKSKGKVQPVNYTLENVKYTGGTDILSGTNTTLIKQKMKGFRKKICETIENSVIVEKGYEPYFFKDPNINEFKDYKDFSDKFEKALSQSNVAQDDREAIQQIYFKLTKSDNQWEELLTEKDRWTDAFGILLALQNEVLHARNNTFRLIRSRISGCGEYGFSHIIPIVNGPEVAEIGDTIHLQVFYGAININKTPEVIVFDGGKVVSSKNGFAFVEVPIQKGKELKVEGSITVRNKSGVPKTENWSKRIVVIPNQ